MTCCHVESTEWSVRYELGAWIIQEMAIFNNRNDDDRDNNDEDDDDYDYDDDDNDCEN